jgi:hypothetical protein
VLNGLLLLGNLVLVIIRQMDRYQVYSPINWYRASSHVSLILTCSRPRTPIGFWDVEALTFSRQSAHQQKQASSWASFLLELLFDPENRSCMVLRMSRYRDGLDSRGSNRGKGKIILFSTSSRPALGYTQPPIRLVPGAISLVVKRPVCEADHSF